MEVTEMDESTARFKGSSSVQDIFFSSLQENSSEEQRRRGSRIPVRRDSSSPPSLPSSGRSTPVYRPAMQREASSPPGLMSIQKARPPIAPKPKIVPKLTASQTVAALSSTGTGASRLSKIPRPDKILKKWDSTSKLEMKRTSSDLNDTNLRKRALTQSSSVNLPRSVSESTSNLSRPISGSYSNLSRIGSGSATNLSRLTSGSTSSLRSAPAFTKSVSASFTGIPALSRSSSTSSFSTVDFHKSRQAPATKADESKSSGRRISKPRREEEVERLKEELQQSRQLIEDLRGAVEQKENIAKLAVDSNQGKNEDYEKMYKNLCKEHSNLSTKAKDWEGKVTKMEQELKEARDTADLLEFRLLELEQRESRERTPEIERRTDTASETSCVVDSGCSSQTTIDDLIEVQKDFRNEKVADTKLKLHELMNHIPEPDGKSLLLQTVALFETLLSKIKLMKEETDGLKADKTELEVRVAEHAKAEDRAAQAESELVHTCEELEEMKQKVVRAETLLNQTKLETSKIGSINQQVQERQDQIAADLRKENEQVLSRLETERKGFLAEKQMYQDVIEKHSQQERIIKEQKARLEDQEARLERQEVRLTEQLAKLDERENTVMELQRKLYEAPDKVKRRESVESAEYHHSKASSLLSETKTTGSSSGVSSDVSDSENSELDPDHRHRPNHHQHDVQQHKLQEYIPEEQFTESGIFEEVSSLEQSLVSNMERSVLMEHSETGTQTTLEQNNEEEIQQLRAEIRKLSELHSKSQAEYDLEAGHHPVESNRDFNADKGNVVGDNALHKEFNLKDEYGSCEELEKINSTRIAEIQKEELESLSTRLKEMEEKWEALYHQHQQVVEERCELEEAENDSRLKAQTLEMQYAGALERSQIIKDELIMERQNSEELRLQLDEVLAREERNMEDIDALQIHLQEQEQLIRELEEREGLIAEQLRLLDMGVKISNWWKAWSWIILPQEGTNSHNPSSDPEADEEVGEVRGVSALTYTPDQSTSHMKKVLTQQLGNINHMENQYKLREESLCTQIENIEIEFENFLDRLLNILFGHVQITNKREEVVSRVRGLVEAEASLKKQIADLEKKEAVYSKTIQEADVIMARVEYNAQEQIKMLEQEKHELKEALWSIQQKKKNKEEEQNKEELNTIKELETKLHAVEESEAQLKLKVKDLETSQQNLNDQLAEKESKNLTILSELKNQDEMKMEVDKMKEEREALSLEVTRLKEVENILVQLRKSEEELKARLKNMEEVKLREEEERNIKEKEEKEKERLIREAEEMEDVKAVGERRMGEGEEARTETRERRNLTITRIRKESEDGDEENIKRKVNTLRLEVKSLDALELESRTSDLESSERYSRFDPLSRGNSVDRDLSDDPDVAKHRSRTDSGNPEHDDPRASQDRRLSETRGTSGSPDCRVREGAGSPDYRTREGTGSPDYRSELIFEDNYIRICNSAAPVAEDDVLDPEDASDTASVKVADCGCENDFKSEIRIESGSPDPTSLEVELKSSKERLEEMNKTNIRLQTELKKLEDRVEEYLGRISILEKNGERSLLQWNLILAEREAMISSLREEVQSLEEKLSLQCAECAGSAACSLRFTGTAGQLPRSPDRDSSLERSCSLDWIEGFSQEKREGEEEDVVGPADIDKCLQGSLARTKCCESCGGIMAEKLNAISNQIHALTLILVGDMENLVDGAKDGEHPQSNTGTSSTSSSTSYMSTSPDYILPDPFSSTDFNLSQIYTAPLAAKSAASLAAQSAASLSAQSAASLAAPYAAPAMDSLDVVLENLERSQKLLRCTPSVCSESSQHQSMDSSCSDVCREVLRCSASPYENSPYASLDSGIEQSFTSGVGVTRISINRDSDDQIVKLTRQDNCEPADTLYSRLPFNQSINHCLQIRETSVTDASSQTVVLDEEEDNNICRMVEEQKVVVTRLRERLEDRERAMIIMREQLIKSKEFVQEERLKTEEKMLEINLLGRQIDQLQREKDANKGMTSVQSREPPAGRGFIIKDLQNQIQQLHEKNTKKDTLIRKMAEVLSTKADTRQVVETIRESTIKPSDRRIDFDIETLCSFIERRKSSVSEKSR